MKLIDLLKQELPKRGGWKNKAMCYVQDGDGTVKPSEDPVPKLGNFVWVRNKGSIINRQEFMCDILADDWNTAIVTREQYEATQWNGEGLPPVGTLIEVNSQRHGWIEATVTAVTDNWIVAKYSDGAEFAGCHRMLKGGLFIDCRETFRPLRTERDKAVKEMLKVFSSNAATGTTAAMGALYDAGYRKQ